MKDVPNAITPYCPTPSVYAFPAKPRNVKAEKLVAARVKKRIGEVNFRFARK